MEKTYRYCLIIEYIGTNFSGSQVQPGRSTIQSELEQALKIILKKQVKTIFSGRTDAGVHSFGQVVHFDIDQDIDKRKFLYSINALLPDDISVKALQKVDKPFHSQKSARYRWYRYLIYNTQQRSVFLKHISNHIPEKLDVEKMQKALDYIKGCHDFSCFKGANSDNPAKECNILYASCKKFSDIIYIDLIANRFLYNMVRIITGTLIDIGRGCYESERMLEILESRDRRMAGPTASAKGLTLMYVGYDEKYNFREIMNMEAINEQNVLCKAS